MLPGIIKGAAGKYETLECKKFKQCLQKQQPISQHADVPDHRELQT
jgi:hypothetical protein